MNSECVKAINRDDLTLLCAVNASDGASLDVFQICITERMLSRFGFTSERPRVQIHPLRVIAATAGR
jgi:hypothetical protein